MVGGRSFEFGSGRSVLLGMCSVSSALLGLASIDRINKNVREFTLIWLQNESGLLLAMLISLGCTSMWSVGGLQGVMGVIWWGLSWSGSLIW